MSMIVITLAIMLVLTLFSVIFGANISGGEIGDLVDNELLVNGSTTTLEWGDSQEIFFIDPVAGAIVMFVAIAVIAGITGITVLGSGLSPESVRIVLICTIYGGAWGLLSILSIPLIISIELFGSIIYITLTIVYVVGVIQKISGK